MQSILMVVAGMACLLVSLLATYKLRPRDGLVANGWLERDGAATALALGWMLLVIIGVALILSGVAG